MMRQLINKIRIIVLLSVVLLAFSCHEETSCDECDLAGDTKIEGDYRPPISIADGTTIKHPSAILGAIADTYAEAFKQRFTNITSVSDQTKVIIIDSKQLSQFSDAILKVYRDNGIVVIVNSDYNNTNNWIDSQDIEVSKSTENKSIFAIHLNKSYSLDECDDEIPLNDYLNPMTEWINSNLNQKIKNDPQETDDITQIIDPQTITDTYNFSITNSIGYGKYIRDTINGVGQVTIRYSIYPLFSFEGNNNEGDYYIVKSQVVSSNEGIYRGNYYKRNKDFNMLVCGFYMKELRILTQLLDGDVSIGEFPLLYTPSPATSINSTIYTSGFSWAISGSIRVGFDPNPSSAKIAIVPNISFSNKEVRNISDVDISNNSTNSDVVYRYSVNNLPKKKPNAIEAEVKISEPPLISISNYDFIQMWIWRVKSTKDNDQSSRFTLKNQIEVDYGSCCYVWKSLPSKQLSISEEEMGFSEQCITQSDYSINKVIPPNRTPVGKIKILNSNNGKYITQIMITKLGEEQPIAVSSGSLAYNKYYETLIPIGTYTIRFKMGSTSSNVKNYSLAESTITIDKDSNTELFSSFNFIEL